MVNKGANLVLRISIEQKAEIQSGANALGQSLTTFFIDAALKQARGVHGGVPTWFRATCYEAANGGATSYETAGRKLASAVGAEVPHNVDLDDWVAEVAVLIDLLAGKDERGAWEWFQQHYPKFMALVPARRREQFIAGVLRAYLEDCIAV
jgi:Protein of unknown function (DUF1778)